MTEFGSPWAFILLLPVLLLPLQGWITGRNRLAIARLDTLEGTFSVRVALAWLPAALRVFGLVLLVIALARPRITLTDTIVESEGLDIVLAVDTSGSMQEQDMSINRVSQDRLEVAKRVLRDFVEGRPHDRIGVVVFGEEAFTFVPLTTDHGSLLEVLRGVEIGVAGAKGTAIGSAIAVGAKRLKDLDAPSRVLIVLTDGRNNAGHIQPMEAAQAAAALDIKVYTIGVGAQNTGMRGIFFGSEGLDEEGLKAIADVTGGRFFRAQDSKALRAIYETIDELEPSPAEVRELVHHEELFRRFAVPGLVLLAFMSSTFSMVTPYSSASTIAVKAQRTTSDHCSSPWATTGPSGSLEMISGRMT